MKRNKIQFIVIVFMVLFTTSLISAQEIRQKEKPQNRVILGGGLGLQFGTVTVIDVSPIIGYKVTERFIPGIGFSYQYYKDTRWIPDYETSIYGGSVFARYYLWQDLFAHAEYQILSYERYDGERVDVPGLLVGGGYRQWIGRNFAATIVVLFNLNETIDTPYQNPVFRIGFQAGL